MPISTTASALYQTAVLTQEVISRSVQTVENGFDQAMIEIIMRDTGLNEASVAGM